MPLAVQEKILFDPCHYTTALCFHSRLRGLDESATHQVHKLNGQVVCSQQLQVVRTMDEFLC